MCRKCRNLEAEISRLKKVIAEFERTRDESLEKSKELEEQKQTFNAYLEMSIQQV